MKRERQCWNHCAPAVFDETSLKDKQSDLVNIGKDVKGVQLGLVNYTKNLHGVQVGLANIVTSNPWFTDFPQKLATGFPFVN